MTIVIKNKTTHDTTYTEEIEDIPFPDEYTLKIIPTGNVVTYIFKNPKGYEVAKLTHDQPLMLTELSTVGKEIKKHLNPDGRNTKKAVTDDFDEIKQILQNTLETIIIQATNIENETREQEEAYKKEKLEEALKLLETKDHPLIYIASIVSWLTAGERKNIMLTFIAYCSQIILRNPISVIGLGEGASGKTHIEEVAMGLIPSQYIRHEKSVTEAAMFNRAKDDPYYYDGCIVNYGDLGGMHSQDFILEAKNLLKELQSDGFLNKPLNIPTKDEGWVVEDITLRGYPALTYTTVPGFKFDDQEMSRSIFITPRMDNKAVFNSRKKILGLKLGRTYQQLQSIKEESKDIKYIVEVLRERITDIEIINPYGQSVIDFLGESEYFKRDFDKYNGLFLTIIAFNSFNRQTYEIDGKEILFTSLQDIQIFISLLESYHRSISVNISPKAAEVLKIYEANKDDWIFKQKMSDEGITINEFYEITESNLSKRSVRRYFSELNNAGFLKVVGKRGPSNIYDLTDKTVSDFGNLLKLDEPDCELIKWELGHEALDFIKQDTEFNGLSIELQDLNVDSPGWEVDDQL